MTVSLATITNINPPVTDQGIGSGINIAGLVTSLVAATIQPQVTLLNNSNTTDQTTISALGAVQSALSSLQTAAQSITTGGSLSQLSAQSSNSSVFSATANSGAVAGNYQVQVQTVAAANTIESPAYSSSSAAVATGNYTITAGGTTFTVAINSSNDTLSGLAAAINSATGNSGVSAAIVNGTGGSYLLLSATQTGTANAVSVASSSPISFTTVQSAADATGSIDGLAFDSASNVVSNALTGVDLNLASAAPGSTETLTVGPDVTTATTAVQTFVSAYNAAMTLLTTDTAYTPATSVPGSSSSTAAGSAGPLLGNVGMENVWGQLQAIAASSTGSTSDTYTSLSQLGITMGAGGQLTLNTATLDAALQSNPSGVQQLFSGTNGLGTQLVTMLNTVAGAGGTIATQTTNLQAQETTNNNQLAQLTAQSAQLTAMYNSEFNAMDNIVAAYKSTAALLTQLYTPTNNSSSSGSSSSSSG